jgi:transposase InsO family protein
MSQDTPEPARLRWAELRFSIIGTLLASPPEYGALKGRLRELAAKPYVHPTRPGEVVHFAVATIERWYYRARETHKPIVALERKVPKHAGAHPRMPSALGEALAGQYRQHPTWSYQLHYDNLQALAREDTGLGAVPSYPTVRRYMKSCGMLRQSYRRSLKERASSAEIEVQARETRSYEHAYVHGLWHLDFHQGSRKVLLPNGQWRHAFLLGVLDDCSRLCCHAQWYLDEGTESLVHALSQAILKRGLPRSLLSDNGSAMVAAETREGLARLSVLQSTTLPYSPQQNGKQESFWGRIEQRLLAMLEGEPELTLPLLNEATQAWVEQEYHRTVHGETGQTPLERALAGPSVVRPSPSTDELRRAFKMQLTRAQRRGDGTLSVEGVRFEVPGRYRSLVRCTLRVARWDLSSVDLVDPHTGVHLATLLPLDKQRNADGYRRALRTAHEQRENVAPSGMAPRLRELMREYAATGLPPAYLTKHDDGDESAKDEDNP